MPLSGIPVFVITLPLLLSLFPKHPADSTLLKRAKLAAALNHINYGLLSKCFKF
jgi:hypothetical protein